MEVACLKFQQITIFHPIMTIVTTLRLLLCPLTLTLTVERPRLTPNANP